MASSPSARPSIVIPAHNEGSVIDRCLETLAMGVEPGWAEIVVVCNACTDDTADRARRYDGVNVVETPEGGKVGALNLGDTHAEGFPRAYVDADVVVTGSDLAQVFGAMTGEVKAAAPGLEVNVDAATWPVKAWYQIWTRLPYVTDEMVGCGIFCLTEAGHERVSPFPEVLADDEHVRLSFTPGERRSVSGTTFRITPPQDLATLIRVEARRRSGNRQIRSEAVLDTSSVDGAQKQAVASLAKEPKNWLHLAMFGVIKIAVSATVRMRGLRGTEAVWTRDLSSR